MKEDELETIMKTLMPILDTVDTVVSVGLVTRFAEDGSLPVADKLNNMGFTVRPNAKINVGLGRPLMD